MSRIGHWMNRVLPPRVAVVVVALLIAIALVGGWIFASLGEHFGWDFEQPYRLYYMVLAGATISYAIWRSSFHPAFDNEYANWLASSPWTLGRSLPRGPIHWVWQDAIIVAALALLGAVNALSVWNWQPLAIFVARWAIFFAVANILALSCANFMVRADGYVAATLAFLASSLLAWHYIAAVWTTVALAYACCLLGVKAGLRAFPWDDPPPRSLESMFTQSVRYRNLTTQMIYWKYFASEPLTIKRALVGAGLIAWIGFCVALPLQLWAGPLMPREVETNLRMLQSMGIMLGLSRLMVYIAKHHPPISFFGRLFTLRWIIPGYDCAFVAPLTVGVLGAALPRLLVYLDAPLALVWGLSTFAMFAVALGVGPTRRDWHLCGDHRLRMPAPARRRRLRMKWQTS